MNRPSEAMRPIATPCVKICALDPASDICLGCGRTLAEVACWTRYSDAERAAIMSALPERLGSLAPSAPAKTGAG